MPATYTDIPLSNFSLYYDSALVDGAIVNPTSTRGYSTSSPQLTLDPILNYEIQIDYKIVASDGSTTVDAYVDLWSMKSNRDPDNSYWYEYYSPRLSRQPVGSIGTLTCLIGPGRFQWDAAHAAGEDQLLLDTTYLAITGFRYRAIADLNAEVAYTAPLPLDTDEALEKSWGADGWLIYENYYSTGAKVWDDIVVVAWTTQGQNNDYAFEARAVRLGQPASVGQVPTIEAGPKIFGPEIPEGDYRIGHVARIADGIAFIQQNNSNSTLLGSPAGWFVSVDRDSLAITVIGTVDCGDPDWGPEEWSWPPAYRGDGRVLLQIRVANHVSGGTDTPYSDTRMIFAISPDRSVQRRLVPSFPAGYDGTVTFRSGFMWNSVMAMVSLDDGSWLSILRTWDGGSVYSTKFYRHADASGLPADNPELVLTHAAEWDFDGVYAAPMANGLVYIIEADNNTLGSTRIWVLDTTTWTLSLKVTETHARTWGNAAHLMDAMSIDRIDDTRALVSWFEDASGNWPLCTGVVAVFDGEKLVERKSVLHAYAQYSPYQDRNLYNIYNFESYYVGNGRALTVAVYEEDDVPVPATVENPVMTYQTFAIGTTILTLPKALRGGPVYSRRAFSD